MPELNPSLLDGGGEFRLSLHPLVDGIHRNAERSGEALFAEAEAGQTLRQVGELVAVLGRL
jgi:hypothetical protein